MNEYVNSPVLVPFGKDIHVFEDLDGCDVYVNPPYHFWAKNIQISFDNSLNNINLNYIKDKINDDYSGIINRSKYYRIFRYLFNIKTALCLDTLYQIELDQKSKDILIFILSNFIEFFMDDNSKCKNINITLEFLNELLTEPLHLIPRPKVKSINLKLIIEPIGMTKFKNVYDSIPRVMRIYDRNYLGFIELFTGVKERLVSYDDILINTIKNNLLQGGKVRIKDHPHEITEKLVDILTDEGLKFTGVFWRKPDIKVIKITKGITRNL